MELVPEHRALLAVDVVGAGQKQGYERNSVRVTLEHLVTRALRESDIDLDADVLDSEWQGDGVLLTLRSPMVGRLLDATHRLDELTSEHNRERRPDMRLRVAVELGPVGEKPGLYDAKITVNRMLSAKAFKDEVQRCLTVGSGSVHTGLIISHHVWRVAFSGDYTSRLRRHEFTRLEVEEKEFAETAWIRVHGYHARPATLPEPEQPPHPMVPSSGAPAMSQVAGSVSGIQAGTVHGGIRFEPGQR